ncbi:efflux RND transporter periplasmic adaptor subunit [Pararhizobium haloflavum]|uniref:efflux RND transporter periplasmic adaptor subunit n=1 Tax=Pararhizobium haloflavum TaxID=2037914 RepID=UPI000C190739|nr:HlyD family efflux transporter periplasmic adaptor subunit [Pararhizobium haloflavum]
MNMSPRQDSELVTVEDARHRQESRAYGVKAARIGLQAMLMLVVLAGSYAVMNEVIAARPERQPRVFEPTVYAVEAVSAERADHRPQISLYGDVVAGRAVDLRPQVTGEIVDVNPQLKVGERIEAGDFILAIDPFAYEGALTEARANLAQAEAALREIEARIAAENDQLQAAELQLEIAESDLTRARSLSERGAATQQTIDERRLVVSQRQQAVSQSRNALVVEEAQRAQQEANIERLEWLVRQAERDLASTRITAPISGVVSAASAEAGRTAGSGDILASIYDDQALEARFTLTDAQYGRIVAEDEPLIGRPIEAEWNVGSSTYRYGGTIDRLGATVASDRGGIEIFASLQPGADAVALRPGAFLGISLPDRLYTDTLRLPESALYDGDHVFVIVDGALSRREVEVKAHDGDQVLVAGAVEDGEQVLTTRLTEADDGLPVRIAGDTSPTAAAREDKAHGDAGDRGSPGPGRRASMRAFGG